MREPERRTIPFDDGELSVLQWGTPDSNRPTLVFDHANGMNAFLYRRLLGALADEAHILAADARGHGKTTLKADPAELLRMGWDRFVEDQIAFIETLGRPVVLAGHSRGAVVSMHLAARRPDLVESLVMLDPVMFPPHYNALWGLARRLGLAERSEISSTARKRNRVWDSFEDVLHAYHGRGAFKTWPDVCLRDYLKGGTFVREDGKLLLSCDPAWEAASFATMSEYSWARLARTRCPLFLVYGGKSNAFFDSSARAFRKRRPDAVVLKIAAATHFVPMEFPITTRNVIRQALRLG